MSPFASLQGGGHQVDSGHMGDQGPSDSMFSPPPPGPITPPMRAGRWLPTTPPMSRCPWGTRARQTPCSLAPSAGPTPTCPAPTTQPTPTESGWAARNAWLGCGTCECSKSAIARAHDPQPGPQQAPAASGAQQPGPGSLREQPAMGRGRHLTLDTDMKGVNRKKRQPKAKPLRKAFSAQAADAQRRARTALGTRAAPHPTCSDPT